METDIKRLLKSFNSGDRRVKLIAAAAALGVLLILISEFIPQQSAKVKTALANAIAKIEAMKKPFVLNYSDISSKNAMDALNELDEELDELEDLLKAYANNETQNTQLKATAEKYYQNVVLATYRGLADQGKRLAERVEKISQ